MKFVDGWWVPDSMSGPDKTIRRADAARLKGYKGDVCIQAGGHVGVYPAAMSPYFKRVYTFEPDLDNFQCLARNCVQPNIFIARGVLGTIRGCVGLNKHKNTGGHTVDGEGFIPLYRIDDMALDACDMIYLDVEGYEVHALRGAVKTISAYKPIIVAEENKQLIQHGFKRGDIEKLLKPYGYKVVSRIEEDIILEAD